jgi:hypothetical protein
MHEEDRYEIAEVIDNVMMMKILYDEGEPLVINRHMHLSKVSTEHFLSILKQLGGKFPFFSAEEYKSIYNFSLILTLDKSLLPEPVFSKARQWLEDAIEKLEYHYGDYAGEWQGEDSYIIEFYSFCILYPLLKSIWSVLKQIQNELEKEVSAHESSHHVG